MGKSCKELAQSLYDCMKETPCVKNGTDVRECLKRGGEGDPSCGNCQELRSAYFNCKRGGLDMRSRIRGPRVY